MSNVDACLMAALHYCALGWSVIPVCVPNNGGTTPGRRRGKEGSDGKAPLVPWKRFQTERADKDTVSEWWRRWPGCNVGVIMGAVSNIVAWDVDDAAGWTRLCEICNGDPPTTWEFFTGSGGRRLIYSWPDRLLPSPRHFKTDNHALTFLGNGSYSVMPPSLHRCGAVYEWAPGRFPGDLPLTKATPAMVHALTVAKRANRKPVGGGVADDKAPVGYERDAILRRARAWARKCEPAITGQGGRVVCFKLACALIHGFGLSAVDAWDLMKTEWNHRCLPPWSDAELWGRVQSALYTGSFPRIEEREKPAGR